MNRSDNWRLADDRPALHDDLARDVAPVKDGQAGHDASFSRVAGSRKARIPVKAGETALIGEAEPFGRGPGLRLQIRVVELREMHHATVIAEVIVAQLRKAVEAEAPNDERVEMADKKIGEVERAGLLFGELQRTPHSPA